MTIIVCLKASNSVIVAADSRSTKSSAASNKTVLLSGQTRKIHGISSVHSLISASSGLANIGQEPWSQIMNDFKKQMSEKYQSNFDINCGVKEIYCFINQATSRAPASAGSCAGGNTFLVAGWDKKSEAPTIWKIERLGDERLFEFPIQISPAANTVFIDWFGDTDNLQEYKKKWTTKYDANMDQDDAMEFAKTCIEDGIHSLQRDGGDICTAGLVRRDAVPAP